MARQPELLPPAAVRSANPPLVAVSLPDRLWLGTSSWAFPGWRGLVYGDAEAPARLAREGLRAYAASGWLRTVSIDRSFYAPLPAREFERLADQVPPGFRFVAKVHRALVEPRVGGARNPFFLDARRFREDVLEPFANGAAEHAAQLLLQFSPAASRLFVRHRDLFDQRLAAFLTAVGRTSVAITVEVRDGRLLDDRLLALLAAGGAAPCLTIHPAMPPLAEQWPRARPFVLGAAGPGLSLRWNLGHGLAYEQAREAYAPFDRIVAPDDVTHAAVACAIRASLAAGRDTVVIANNKAEGSAPLTLARLAEAVTAPMRP